MNLFAWDPLFDTGIELVDGQHRQLVALINRLGGGMISGDLSADAQEGIFRELADYAQHHFADEERLMCQAAIDPGHIEHHRAQHRDFLAQVTELWQRHLPSGESGEALHSFLTAWLTFHILEEDQTMARQFHRVREPLASAAAEQSTEVSGAKANKLLLTSIRELHRSLAEANAQLEDQVRTRTQALLQSEKMRSVGQLAAGVAHEINNPLGFISSNVVTLGRYAQDLIAMVDACDALTAPQPELAVKFEAIKSRADLPFLRSDLATLLTETTGGLTRVKNIVGALRSFSEESREDRRATDLLASLESTLVIAGNLLSDRIELVRQLVPLPPVACAAGEINQVFLALLVNAAQAIADVGFITLRSGFDDAGVWVEIADSGCGIAEEHRKRLFEPFFTTRPPGQGTGLGLFVAWDIVVKKHGGRIDVRSAPGQGSAFTLWLPRTRNGVALA